jgi:hypothetical protein
MARRGLFGTIRELFREFREFGNAVCCCYGRTRLAGAQLLDSHVMLTRVLPGAGPGAGEAVHYAPEG